MTKRVCVVLRSECQVEECVNTVPQNSLYYFIVAVLVHFKLFVLWFSFSGD